MMVKEFEIPSFAEPVGTVTEPIQTQFGWHLIHVIDKK
jgi:parvulin-like peptidyl-prolyl isomerase